MCRMLGIYGQVDRWKDIVLSFSHQAETGKVPPKKGLLPGHKDGWGMAASDSRSQSMVIVARHPGSAAGSKQFEKTLATIEKQPTIFICHLRKASPGIPVTPENIHPFYSNGFCFIHNGTIYQADSLPRNPALPLTSDGSDSELFFHYLLSQLEKEPVHRESVQSIANAISLVNLDYTAINFLLSSGTELFVARQYREYGSYYSLYTYRFPRGVIILSEPVELDGLDPSGWVLIENNTLLKINGKSPRIEEHRMHASI